MMCSPSASNPSTRVEVYRVSQCAASGRLALQVRTRDTLRFGKAPPRATWRSPHPGSRAPLPSDGRSHRSGRRREAEGRLPLLDSPSGQAYSVCSQVRRPPLTASISAVVHSPISSVTADRGTLTTLSIITWETLRRPVRDPGGRVMRKRGASTQSLVIGRSEERRVGKEC